jgi:hypothetical protein
LEFILSFSKKNNIYSNIIEFVDSININTDKLDISNINILFNQLDFIAQKENKTIDEIIEKVFEKNFFYKKKLKTIIKSKFDITKKGFDIIINDVERKTTSMREKFLDYLSSAECMRDIKGIDEDIVSNEVSRFAPFVAWMQKTKLGSSVRAEALAHLHLYIESGWAENDLSNNHPIGNVKQQNTILKLRKLADRVLSGEIVSIGELTSTIQARFDQLFIPAVVVSSQNGYTLQPVSMDKKRFKVKGDTVQGPGMVDVLIRSAENKHKLLMSAATANKDTISHRDQLARHASAIQACAISGKPPLKKGDWLGSIMLHTVALIPDYGKSELGEELKNAWKSSKLSWSTKKQGLFFNLLPLFSILGSGLNSSRLNPSLVLRTRHFQMGSKGGCFNNEQTDEELACQVASFLATGIKEFGVAVDNLRFRSSQKKFEGKKILNITMDMLVQSCEGLLAHFGSVDETDYNESPLKIKCSQEIKKILSETVPSLLKIAESGFIQLDDQLWAKNMLSLATKIDGNIYIAKKFKTSLNSSIRALTRESAELGAKIEFEIEQKEKLTIDFLKTKKSPLPPKNLKTKLIRCAQRLEFATFNKLLNHLKTKPESCALSSRLDSVIDEHSLLRFISNTNYFLENQKKLKKVKKIRF